MSGVEGVEVETTVNISWYALGLHTLADEPDYEQVALLQGFGTGLKRLTALQRDMQLQYIAEKALKNKGAYDDMIWLIDGLHARLHEGETA